jgi:hypothetical protein
MVAINVLFSFLCISLVGVSAVPQGKAADLDAHKSQKRNEAATPRSSGDTFESEVSGTPYTLSLTRYTATRIEEDYSHSDFISEFLEKWEDESSSYTVRSSSKGPETSITVVLTSQIYKLGYFKENHREAILKEILEMRKKNIGVQMDGFILEDEKKQFNVVVQFDVRRDV